MLSNAHHGISIYIRALDKIEVAQDGKSALVGGGAYVDEAIRTFAAHGKASCKFWSPSFPALILCTQGALQHLGRARVSAC